MPDGDRPRGWATLRRFSRIALWPVVSVAVIGLAQPAGELSSPVQLSTTGHSRDLMLEAAPRVAVLILQAVTTACRRRAPRYARSPAA